MARTNKQVLINFHSSGKTTELPVSQLEYGEIAVRHHEEKPELYIKTGDNAFATFVDSAKTQTMINGAVSAAQSTLQNNIDAVSTALTAASANIETTIVALSGVVETMGGNITETLKGYVTTGALNTYKGEVSEDIEEAKNAAIGAASAYTDGQVSAAKTTLEGQINNVAGNVEALSGVVKSFSAGVETTLAGYVTTGTLNTYKTEVTGAISTAKNEVYASAATYTDGKISAAKTTLENAINTASANIETTIATLADQVDSVKDNYVKTSTYTEYTAATKTAYEKAATDAKDAAIAAVSGYANTSINVLQTSLEGQIGDVVADVEALSGVVETMGGNITETLKGYVTTGALNTYKGEVSEDIEEAKNAAIGAASAYTDGQVSTVQNSLESTDAALGTLSGRVDTLVGSDTTKSAREIAAEEAAAAVKLVVSGASDTFDTLKEVEDWINTHSTSAATMMSDITELKASATSANTRLTTAENDIDKAEADIKVLSGAVETKYATSAATVNAISAVDAKFKDYATSAATEVAINAVDAKFKDYATSAATEAAINAEATARKNTDDALGLRIGNLEAISGATSSAVQTIVVENSTSNKITATKTGTEVKFNFDNMVIDGGTF